jgi:hypothetical protein
MEQTFSVERDVRINLTRVRGSLTVQGWDQREVRLRWEDEGSSPTLEGNVVSLAHCADDLEVWTPYDAELRVEGVDSDVSAQDVKRIELKDVRGTVELRNIGIDANLEAGEAILITEIGGDLEVQRAASLRTRRKIGGAAKLQDVPQVMIEAVRSDLDLYRVNTASLGSVGSDLTVVGVDERLHCGNVGGDCRISESAGAEIGLGNVGGDLQLDGALQIHMGNAGGDAELREVQGDVHIGNIGGDGTLHNVGGDLTAGQIGGDARLRGMNGSTRVGGIGGDLDLQASFGPESKTHLNVGGDAQVFLSTPVDLSLQATVGGVIDGSSLSFTHSGNIVRLVYGEGQAQVHLSVGGDLHLRGAEGESPRVSSANMPWREFGQEMAELGQSMAQLGQDLGKEFQDMFSEMGRASFSWSDEVGRKVEEQMRRAREKAEHHARKAEEHARKAEERARRHMHEQERRHADRMYVRVNEREWQMNPERLNDLLSRAQQAALDGVAGALDAVERSLGNLRGPRPPYPTRPPVPPTPPTPPMPPAGGPVPPAPPMPPMPPVGGPIPSVPPVPPTGGPIPPYPPSTSEQTEAGESEEEGPNLEAEREAILRMIAEGRITPEEGDMLLEGLGEQ